MWKALRRGCREWVAGGSNSSTLELVTEVVVSWGGRNWSANLSGVGATGLMLVRRENLKTPVTDVGTQERRVRGTFWTHQMELKHWQACTVDNCTALWNWGICFSTMSKSSSPACPSPSPNLPHWCPQTSPSRQGLLHGTRPPGLHRAESGQVMTGCCAFQQRTPKALLTLLGVTLRMSSASSPVLTIHPSTCRPARAENPVKRGDRNQIRSCLV